MMVVGMERDSRRENMKKNDQNMGTGYIWRGEGG